MLSPHPTELARPTISVDAVCPRDSAVAETCSAKVAQSVAQTGSRVYRKRKEQKKRQNAKMHVQVSSEERLLESGERVHAVNNVQPTEKISKEIGNSIARQTNVCLCCKLGNQNFNS